MGAAHRDDAWGQVVLRCVGLCKLRRTGLGGGRKAWQGASKDLLEWFGLWSWACIMCVTLAFVGIGWVVGGKKAGLA